MNLKALAAATVLTLVPAVGFAATIQGQLDITGQALTRDLTDAVAGDVVAGGAAADNVGVDVDFVSNGLVTGASGDFGAAGLGFGDIATMVDIDFSAAPATVYTLGAFTFTGVNFHDFQQDAGAKDFTVSGILSAAGFDDTVATMTFTTQNSDVAVSFSTTTTVPLPAGVLLMGTALAGFGVMRRRKKAA